MASLETQYNHPKINQRANLVSLPEFSNHKKTCKNLDLLFLIKIKGHSLNLDEKNLNGKSSRFFYF